MKRIEKPVSTRATTTTYITVAVKAAVVMAAAVIVIRIERIFIKVRILGLKK